MRHLTFALIAAGSLLTTSTASALTAKQTVEKEIVVQMPDGTETMSREVADTVTPGERVVYTLDFTNDDAAPASDLVLTMPVPAEIKLIEGSAAQEGARVVYSADGGKSFAERSSVRVATSDGTLRAANANDITHVRWTVPGPVAVGDSGSLSFKGILE